ncbi:FxLYD domain-containing protein [Natronococcus wangiae]|uniref:FxLYD domain-containing protein n=1 Tax=Natronococcus wangiae TaxID=3068275 RepID=UPI00273EC764|nr:FxLYD domain-containing protein [Natronococcus sp. AD5]
MTQSPLSRRRVLGALGAGGAGLFAGCNDVSDGGEPKYEAGEVTDLEASNRSAENVTAAEALAEQEANEGVTALDTLTIRNHEFVLEDSFHGPTVQGTVANTGEDRIELVEVRVRVFNESGNQIGRYLDVTGDLPPNSTWEFQVVLLELTTDIAEYDIAVLGTPS